MPHYRILFSKNGRTGTRVLDAASEQQAVEAMLSEGATIVGLEEIRVQIGTGELPSSASPTADVTRTSDWSDFWRFRMMIAPAMIRWSFLIATCVVVLGLVTLPIQYVIDRRGIGSKEAATVRRIEKAIPFIESLRQDLALAEAEVARLDSMPGHSQAAAEADSRADRISIEIQAARQSAGIGAIESESQALAAARSNLKQRSSGTTTDLVRNLVTLIFAWVSSRLLAEVAIVLFRIHEQLVSIADRVERAR